MRFFKLLKWNRNVCSRMFCGTHWESVSNFGEIKFCAKLIESIWINLFMWNDREREKKRITKITVTVSHHDDENQKNLIYPIRSETKKKICTCQLHQDRNSQAHEFSNDSISSERKILCLTYEMDFGIQPVFKWNEIWRILRYSLY